MYIRDNPPANIEDELSVQAQCYGLPFGAFGIVCWLLTLFSIALVYIKCPLFTPWRWGQTYRTPERLWAIFPFTMIIGPTIYTCIKCRGEWMVVLIAIGQLTPWSVKVFNDGYAGGVTEDRNKFYLTLGMVTTPLLSLCGWIGLTALSVEVRETEESVSTWIWSLYLAGFFVSIVIYKLWEKYDVADGATRIPRILIIL
ncbi:3244_t:CDS:2, partial [Paraglomus brasilianum]